MRDLNTLEAYELLEKKELQEIPEQAPFTEPVEHEIPYSISSTDSTENNTYLSCNWAVGNNLNREQYIAFDILDYALLSTQGAPIKQALLDAGIGTDIYGGYDSSSYQPVFSIVAKHANASDQKRFVQIIRKVLQEQVENGINKKTLLAAINGSEFKFREADFGRFPKGLMFGLQIMDSWLYDENAPFLHIEEHCEKKNEGFLDASKVQYVSRAGNFVEKGYSYTGTLRILKVIMGYDYLWINIRVKGGAYGCMSGFGKNGDTYFASYRDPKLRATNEIYEKIPEYLKEFDADERDMTKYIIGTISEMDTPLTPISRGRRSLICYLGHITDEELQKERDAVLSGTAEDIRALAPLVQAVLEEQDLCVIGNEETLRAEKEMFMELKNLY